ncbi:dephospho-CoA kinase [Vreelandella gomseomensis]|uniref:Dephospho-CoA kinase n=1 Tax=Vreelandella gomseomensis TaxID=370766 RepID=A0ABU1GD09_9GAMM|nr:dephospho-CoA kinase [Halomonas gomseomensis]MDR5874934.1 dephospho-CoA kinase [Halomonas gomseomensis]
MIVGLTGGIGSGKSTVARAFGERGIGWVDADDVAREVVAPGEPALADIRDRFGDRVITDDGSLDRAALRQIIFDAPEERHWLEQLTHPIIRERLVATLHCLQSGTSPYALLVSPLLFESGQAALVERAIVVDVPTDMQLSRTLQRDGVSEANVRAILKAQMSREARLAKADDIIDNSRDIAHMQQQVARLDRAYRARLSP